MPYRRAEEMTYTELRELDLTRTVCFLPVSALEVHGPHLPLGMDLFMARWMAEEAGRRFSETHPDWNVVQLPPLPLGTDELPLAGSMEVSQRTLYQTLLSQGRSLARAGYRYIVLTNGHGGPRHAAAIESACRRVSKRYAIQMFSPAALVLHRIITGQRFATVESLLGRVLGEEERHGLLNGEHAGSWETSFMLARNPSLVAPSWRELHFTRPPSFGPLVRIGERLAGRRERRGRDATKVRELFGGLSRGIGWLLNAQYGYGGTTVTYSGDPSVASADVGHAFREVMVRDCVEIVEAVTAGRMHATEVRSIASDHPPIQPNFGLKLALAVTAVLGLLILW